MGSRACSKVEWDRSPILARPRCNLFLVLYVLIWSRLDVALEGKMLLMVLKEHAGALDMLVHLHTRLDLS